VAGIHFAQRWSGRGEHDEISSGRNTQVQAEPSRPDLARLYGSRGSVRAALQRRSRLRARSSVPGCAVPGLPQHVPDVRSSVPVDEPLDWYVLCSRTQSMAKANVRSVAITYLHHTHPDAAHYDEHNWTYQKGAMSTVDREFGFIGRHIFHGIIEYHVVHHIFP